MAQTSADPSDDVSGSPSGVTPGGAGTELSEGAESPDVAEFPDVAQLPYEAARDELAAIVARLEGDQVPLEEGMRLWRRGEALAAHCTAYLEDAQRQVTGAGPA